MFPEVERNGSGFRGVCDHTSPGCTPCAGDWHPPEQDDCLGQPPHDIKAMHRCLFACHSWADGLLQMRKYGITLGPFWANELVGMLWHQMPAGRLAIFSCKVIAVSCLKLVVALKELQVCSGQGLELHLSSQKMLWWHSLISVRLRHEMPVPASFQPLRMGFKLCNCICSKLHWAYRDWIPMILLDRPSSAHTIEP